MVTFTSNANFVVETCCVCGVGFGLPDVMVKQRRQDHKAFYCPNGHSLSYHDKSDATRVKELQDQLVRERQQADQQRAELRDAAEAANRRAAAARGQTTRIKNRVGRGVCPCCNRFFRDLHRHMAGQHPDYATPVQTVAD